MRPFIVLAINILIGSVGIAIGGFAGGCLIAATLVADCMAVLAEGRAWAREDAADTVYDWSTDGEDQVDLDHEAASHSREGRTALPGPVLADHGRAETGMVAASDLAGTRARLASPQAVARPFDWGREGRAG